MTILTSKEIKENYFISASTLSKAVKSGRIKKLRHNQYDETSVEKYTQALSPPMPPLFNPYREPCADALDLRTVIEGITKDCNEQYRTNSERRLQHQHQKSFDRTVEAVICDVLFHHLNRPEEFFRISRSKGILDKASRYKPVTFNSMLPGLLDSLSADGLEMSKGLNFIEQDKADPSFEKKGKKQTTIKAGSKLIALIDGLDITLDHSRLVRPRETILLKSGKDDFWDTKDLIDYEDTSKSLKAREEMETLNDWLMEADISLLQQPGNIDPNQQFCDPNQRQMARHFNNGNTGFNEGGRLFNGFWMGIKKELRPQVLRIEGQEIATLDFQSMNPSLLYASVGQEMPVMKPYVLPGYEDSNSVPKGMKKIFNSCFYKTARPTRFPRGTKNYFPPEVTVDQIIDHVLSANEPIRHLFFTGNGMNLMYQESEILVAVLLKLRDRAIVALPIHDAVIVRKDKIEETREVMLDVFLEKSGVNGGVSVEQ